MLVGFAGLIVGLVLGYFLHKLISTPVKAGVLFFYNGEDGELPTMAAGLDIPVDEVRKHNEVVFKVSRR